MASRHQQGFGAGSREGERTSKINSQDENYYRYSRISLSFHAGHQISDEISDSKARTNHPQICDLQELHLEYIENKGNENPSASTKSLECVSA